jgi:IS5 family transposase
VDRESGEPAQRAIVAACRIAGWALAAALLIGGAEGLRILRDGVAARAVTADHNRRDFVQRVIACRHPRDRPTRTWHECELEVQNAL